MTDLLSTRWRKRMESNLSHNVRNPRVNKWMIGGLINYISIVGDLGGGDVISSLIRAA